MHRMPDKDSLLEICLSCTGLTSYAVFSLSLNCDFSPVPHTLFAVSNKIANFTGVKPQNTDYYDNKTISDRHTDILGDKNQGHVLYRQNGICIQNGKFKC